MECIKKYGKKLNLNEIDDVFHMGIYFNNNGEIIVIIYWRFFEWRDWIMINSINNKIH